MSPVPRATYRLQLHREFGFDAAAGIVDYLKALGVSHVYTSPYLQAAPGSTHGYDVVDHGRVNEELGGEPAHGRFLEALRAAGLGHVVDVVPNHMSIASRRNRWWWDVLAHGPRSPYARYFDVDWDAPEERLRNVVLLPVLADHYGRVLEAGEIRLWREGNEYTIRYHDRVFPVAPDSLDNGLKGDAAEAQADVARINAHPDRLHALLEQQWYRLAWWQSAQRDLGYRRFFDVNTLIGICTEQEDVFQDTHRLVLEWVKAGHVDGLRIDHPDGLRDPAAYLARLRGACEPCWIVVEKILAGGETLPDEFPVDGATGYDFMNLVLRLFVDPEAEAAFTALYTSFTGEPADFAAVARDKKLLALRAVLGSDVSRLAELLLNVCEGHRRHRDYTRQHLTDALFEILAAFPVYRTYVRPAARQVSDLDRGYIEEAMRRVRSARPDLDGTLLEFITQVLTLQVTGKLESEFVLRFQQLSAPAMAKGVEDTAFYCYNRFVALNEVGGDPARFGVSPARFHEAMAETQRRNPATLLATDTHDAKRGEDVRARLSVLSQRPAEWAAAVHEWSQLNERHRTSAPGGPWPDRNAEYLLYQTLVGTWPIDGERLWRYLEKAAREAKVHTTWTAPDQGYEAALKGFVQAILADADFTARLERFVAPLRAAALPVSLAQTLLKLTAPGVPDIYQGTELGALSLVDPDNRRAVDFARRRELLAAAETVGAAGVMGSGDEGAAKLWMIRKVLAVRAQHAESFGAGATYRPLEAAGPEADRVVAFQRGSDVLVVVPRLMLGRGWGDTRLDLPPGRWRRTFTNEGHDGGVPLRELLAGFPVALLVRDG